MGRDTFLAALENASLFQGFIVWIRIFDSLFRLLSLPRNRRPSVGLLFDTDQILHTIPKEGDRRRQLSPSAPLLPLPPMSTEISKVIS